MLQENDVTSDQSQQTIVIHDQGAEEHHEIACPHVGTINVYVQVQYCTDLFENSIYSECCFA